MELKSKKRDFRKIISALLVAALVFSCFGGNLHGVVVKANGVSGQATGGNVPCNHTGGEATCKDKAICELCYEPYGDLDPENHIGETEVRDDEPGNCGDAGYTGDTYCKDCNQKIATGTTIAPTGNHTGGEATCIKPAECGVCGESYGTVNPNNHKGQTEVRGEVTPTCAKAGYTGDTYCKDCNTKIATGTSTPTKAHKTVFYKADATKKQKSKYVCSVCKKEIKMGTTYYYPKSVTVSTVTYNGKSQTPKVVVKDSNGKTISSSHYSVSKVKNVGKSTITITFKSSSKYYTGKLTAKCTVNPPKTTLKSLSAGSKKLTVKWTKKTSGVTGYQIQYSTSKSFKSAKTVTVKKNKTTSTTIKKLKGKKKYYVRIRTYKTVSGKKYYSAWSSSKNKTTKK